MTGPTGAKGPTGSGGVTTAPVASFDITDRLVTNRGNFSKPIPTNLSISDGYSSYKASTNGYNTYPTTYTFGSNKEPKWLAGGEGGNTLATSTDGIRWTGMGLVPLSTRTNDIAYNGYVWVVVGSGTVSGYTSLDTINWTACIGMPASESQKVKWNGTIFVATFKNGTIYYSHSGVNWTLALTTAATDFNGLDWNGVFFLAGGNVANALYKSLDGITWTTGSYTSTSIRSICWTGGNWILSGTVASGNASSYSTNFDATAWTTFDVSGLLSGVTSLTYNNDIYVAAGITVGNTLAYSYDQVNWTPLGNTISNGTSSYMQVKWMNNKFITVGATTTGTGGVMAYSYEGTRWTPVSGINSVFTTAIKSVEFGSNMINRVTFPANATISGNQISRDGGITWSAINSILSSAPNTVGFNGRNYMFCSLATGGASYTTGELYGTATLRNNYVPLTYAADPAPINAIRHNGNTWLMGGLSSASRHLLKSTDGFNWFATGTGFTNGQPCNGIAWNGNLWVVSAQTNATGSTTNMIYSPDTINWQPSSTTLGGGPVEWNGCCFMAGGPYVSATTTYVSTSSDGITWTSRSIGDNGNVKALAYSGNSWVVATNGKGGGAGVAGLLYSSDGLTFTAVGATNLSYTGVVWNGLTWVAITTGNNICYSYNGQTWTTVPVTGVRGNAIWTRPHEGTALIYSPTVVVGQGVNNGMAYSYDGVNYIGLGTTVFTIARHVFYNGSLWVAGGEGNNTLAYSYDGKVWVGLGKTVFTTASHNITYNGTVWLASGAGGNTLATSPDGKVWTGIGATIFATKCNCADWNGTAWVAVGVGTNTIAYSTAANANIGSWTGLGTGIFSTAGNDIQWMLNKWFAVGDDNANRMASTATLNGSTGWAGVASASGLIRTMGNAIAWNGRLAVAMGTDNSDTIITSTDGVTWTGKGKATFTTSGQDVYWNERLWVLGGVGGNSIAYSFDMSGFYASPNSTSLFASGCFGMGTNSKVGAYSVSNNLYLRQGDKVMVRAPDAYDPALGSDTSISFSLNQIP